MSDHDSAPPMPQPVVIQIAIDGAAGVGKSTIGERLARRLGALYVDSGAFYRALTVVALEREIDPSDAEALTALAQAIRFVITAPSSAAMEEGHQYTVLADGDDITARLRIPTVEGAVSAVSRHPAVRTALIERMRQMADEQSVVMVGRDIGTVVLPNATLKIYLTTSIAHRAARRHGDLVRQQGDAAPSLAQVEAEMAARDAKDAAQMRPAENAITINNDHLEADDVVARIAELLAERQRGPVGSFTSPAPFTLPDTVVATEPIAGHIPSAAPDSTSTTDAASAPVANISADAVSAAPASVASSSAASRSADGAGRSPGLVVRVARANGASAASAMSVAAAGAATGKPAEQSHDGTPAPWFYAFARMVVFLLMPLLARVRMVDIENVPTEGPVMLAANHVAWADIPLISLRVPRITHYMAKIELFHIPILKTIVRLLGAFPVHRGEGDRESLRTAERLLGDGEIVVIFPEGHRSGGHLITGLPGVALIALRANAPIVPVAISGTERMFKGFRYGPFAPRVTVRYGKPFRLAQAGKRRSRDDMERGVDEIMRQIAALLPPEYRGIYAGDALPTPTAGDVTASGTATSETAGDGASEGAAVR